MNDTAGKSDWSVSGLTSDKRMMSATSVYPLNNPLTDGGAVEFPNGMTSSPGANGSHTLCANGMRSRDKKNGAALAPFVAITR